MNGAQHCPECGSKMSIKDTGHGGGRTFRIAECACGIRVETEECQVRRLPARMPHMPGMAPSAVEPDIPTPTVSNPPVSAEGGGGGVSSGSIRPESDPNPDSPGDPKRARARSNGGAIVYPADFVELWEQTGKLGGKFPALKAWMKCGRPSWASVQDTWRAYLRSERPAAGFVQDLSTWLNARGHQQEWPHASSPRRTSTAETFEARRKREHEEASARESERLIFGKAWG